MLQVILFSMNETLCLKLTLWWQERLDLPEFNQLAESMDTLRHQLAGKRRKTIRE